MKPCGPGLLFVGSFLITVSISVLVLACSSFLFHLGLVLEDCTFLFFFLFGLFPISWAASAAHGGSHAGGQIGAIATDLHQSHSSAGSELRLQPTPQLTATTDP